MRLVSPIPSSIKEYTDRMKAAHESSLGAALCGDYEACDKYTSELRQLAAELASWCGLEGKLWECHAGMGEVSLNGEQIEF